MGYYITPDGNYVEGLYVAEGSIEVPQKPQGYYQYTDGKWTEIPVPPPTNAELLAETDKYMSRASEDLIVTLLGKTVITKSDYPQIVWDRINYRRSLRNQQPV